MNFTEKTPSNIFSEFGTYISRMKLFSKIDWLVYFGWVGQIYSLFVIISAFLFFAYSEGAELPVYIWALPAGTFIFASSIALDTIGHRTVYKEELKKAESLVHAITIFSGMTSCILLSMAYSYPETLAIPALVLVFLSFFYSIIDEVMHWQRYMEGKSDRIEMWSHFGIFWGHLTMMATWVYWFYDGYPGVKEALNYFT